jgi:hypothetical protein
MRFMAGLLGLGLSACHEIVWQRMDGQPLTTSAAIERQYSVDLAVCRAAAVNAGNQVPAASVISTTNNVNVTNAVMVQPVLRAPYESVHMPVSPNIATAGAIDPSMFAGAATESVDTAQRSRTEDVNMRACMALRGYRPEK